MIRRIMILDAVRGWIVHLVLGGGFLLLWVLYTIEVVKPATALTWAGGIALAAGLFAAVHRYVDAKTPRRTALLVGIFAVAWGLILFPPYQQAVNLPPPLLQSELRADSTPLPLSVRRESHAGYRLIVEGHFKPTTEHVAHVAHYRLLLHDPAGAEKALEGDFSEAWGRQRLGRRGSVAVHRGRTVEQHRLSGPLSPAATIQLESIGTDAGDSVEVTLFPSSLHPALFALFGGALTLSALLVDALLAGGEASGGVTTTMTLATIGLVAAFQLFASPYPGFGDLAVYGGAGAVAGILVGRGLWNLAERPLERLEQRLLG